MRFARMTGSNPFSRRMPAKRLGSHLCAPELSRWLLLGCLGASVLFVMAGGCVILAVGAVFYLKMEASDRHDLAFDSGSVPQTTYYPPPAPAFDLPSAPSTWELENRARNFADENQWDQAVGAYGAMHIVVRYSASTLHLIQMAGTSGALYVTTVFQKETSPGKRLAVHSRHEYTAVSLPGFTSRPEQYYGECEILQ